MIWDGTSTSSANGPAAYSTEPAAETALTSRTFRQDWLDKRNEEPS